jgi:hypothetical protein
MPDVDQASRIAEGQRPQKYRVHYAENRCVRADAERQHQNRHNGKSRVLAQYAQPVFKVLGYFSHLGSGSPSLEQMRAQKHLSFALGKST